MRLDSDKRDTTVFCWTDLFVNEYLAPQFLASKNPKDKKIIEDFINSKLDEAGIKGLKERKTKYTELMADLVKKPINAVPLLDKSTFKFPIEDKTEFYDHLIRFVQEPNIKEKNGGNGILESMIGIDYLTLGINKDYTLPPTKLNYKDEPGVCKLKNPKAITAFKDFGAKTAEKCKMFCDGIPKPKCVGYELIADAEKPCRLWFVGVKGDGTSGKTCVTKEIIDPNDAKYKQFVLPSQNIDKTGNIIYPKVRYVKMNADIQVSP